MISVFGSGLVEMVEMGTKLKWALNWHQVVSAIGKNRAKSRFIVLSNRK